MRTIRITNNTGVGLGTKVIDVATGQELTGVRAIDITIRPDGPIIARVEFSEVELDVTAEEQAKAADALTDDTDAS